jgi:hypothetical protein
MLSSMLLSWTLALVAQAPLADPSYLVLVDGGKGGEYMKAAQAMAALHDGVVKSFDPKQTNRLLKVIKKSPPRFVAFVLPPDRIDVDLCHAILEVATRVDDDPFTEVRIHHGPERPSGHAIRAEARRSADS